MIKKVIRVYPRGFCAGVTRSIKVVKDALDIFGSPIYIKHAIVHNKTVITDLQKRGAIIVESVAEIPAGAVAIFSAHGSPPMDFKKAKKKNIKVIDATCPLVTRVHFEIITALKNKYQPIYIGHRGHVEAEGVIGEAKVFDIKVPIVETIQDAEEMKIILSKNQKIVILAQTTFNVNKIKKIIKALKRRFGDVVIPTKTDICYATTNRQKAIVKLAQKVDLVIVVGSRQSSNSNRLVEVARQSGVEAYLVDTVEEIQKKWLVGKKSLGLSAGASAPEFRVREIVEYFVQQGAQVEDLEVTTEKIKFTEPISLQKARETIFLKKK